MFKDAKTDLIDALNENDGPVSLSEARAVAGDNKIVAESAINQYATTAEYDGEEYVTAIEGGPSFTVNDLEDADASEAAETDTEPETIEEDASPSAEREPDESNDSDASWAASDDRDLYEINGIRIDADPHDYLVGEPTGEDHYGLPILTNGLDMIPNEPKSYMPLPVGGGRDSEETIGRVMGVMNRPLLLEGDAGTGKNLGIDTFQFETHRSKFRINFGADVSVFDLIGEKDLVDGESYYILGKLAKPALFGGTVIFDEVNMVSGDVSSFIHGVTEEPGNRSLELRGTGVTLTDIPVDRDEIDRYGSWYEAARRKWTAEEHLGVYIHPEFKVTATCNPLDYADTKSMNAAFRDRFVVLEHPYLTETTAAGGPSSKNLNTPTNPSKGVEREAALLADSTGIDRDDALALVDFVAVLREARREANAITCPITHRSLLKIVELAGVDQEFMPFKDATEIVLTGHAATKSDKQYIKDAIADEL